MAGLFSNTRLAASLNNRVSKSNADSANSVRRSNNIASAAEGALSRWVQSVNNGRVLKEGFEAVATAHTNFNRSVDQETMRQFSDDVRGAEQAGMAAAMQAASGTSGSVADNVNAATALREAISDQFDSDRLEGATSDHRKRVGSIASQVIGGLDSSAIIDQIDHNKDVAQVQAVHSRGVTGVRAMVGAFAQFWGVDAGFDSVGGKGKTTKTDATNSDNSGAIDRRYADSLNAQAEKSSFQFQSDDHDYLL